MARQLKPVVGAVLAMCAGAAMLSGCGGNSGNSDGAAAMRTAMGALAGATGGTVQGAPVSSTASNGVSTVAFAGVASRYTIAVNGANYTVTDTEGGDGTVTVTRTQRLQFADTNVSLDVDGIPGRAYRLYQAALNRTPDVGGLGFWISMLDNGIPMKAVSASFISSPEFQGLFGANPTNSELVKGFYRNVLHREAEQAGYDFWLMVLDKKLAPLEDVLSSFADSPENYNAVLPSIANGIRYTPMSRVAVNTVPGAPTNAAATAGNGTASIMFMAPASNGGSAITGYTATCSGSGVSKSATGLTSPLLVSGLANGVAYTCTVTAANALGRSLASASVVVTPTGPVTPPDPVVTVPDAPVIGTPTAGNTNASIAFAAPASNGGAAITAYTATCTGGGASQFATGSSSPLLVTGLTNGVAYSCSVTATNSKGTGAASGSVSVTPAGAVTPPLTVPGAPTIGTGTAGSTSASIAFSAPATNGGANITSYTASCTGGGATRTATGTASPVTVTGLATGVTYLCSVTAANAVGNSAASAAVSVTTAAAVTVPGAPTIGVATAGNASASIAFTAPASNGGAAITGYTASCTGGGATKTGTGAASPVTITGLTNGTAYSCSVKAANAAGSSAASASVTVTPTAGSSGATTSTAALFCNVSNSTTNPTTGMASTVATTCTGTQRKITGNGVPDHKVGAFPNAGNPNTIGPVNVSFTGTTAPAVVSTSGTAVAHILGFALNSVKFDPSTAESYQNAGVWKIEALNQTYFKFGTDTNNAHVQPDGAYHYHGMPEEYITKLGKGTGMVLVGFAVDGFPIYARYGYNTATDAASGTKVMTSSYRLKTTPSTGRPSTSIAAMGTFTQDYEYVAGLGDLDECNGRTGVTPEFPNGIYHYYITDSYPYIQRCVKGTAASTTGP